MTKTMTFRSLTANQEALPEICQKYGCEYRVSSRFGDLLRIGFVEFHHKNGDRIDSKDIPLDYLDDPDRDLWADLRPWAESLPHE